MDMTVSEARQALAKLARQPCPRCQGARFLPDRARCPACGGWGRVVPGAKLDHYRRLQAIIHPERRS